MRFADDHTTAYFAPASVICGALGSTLTGIVPSNTYLCADDKYVVIGANGDSLFKRLMRAIEQPAMADDPRFANNAGRVQHEQEIDAAIGAWTRAHTSAEVLRTSSSTSPPLLLGMFKSSRTISGFSPLLASSEIAASPSSATVI